MSNVAKDRECLFRKQFVEKQNVSNLSSVVLAQPLSFKIITLFLIGIFLSTVIFLTVFTYTPTKQYAGTIVKNNHSSLLFIISVPPAMIKHIQKKQSVNIELEDFPVGDFGYVKGQVKNWQLIQANDTQKPAVKVVIEIKTLFLENTGQQFTLNEHLKGDVLLPQKTETLLQWLTIKLTANVVTAEVNLSYT